MRITGLLFAILSASLLAACATQPNGSSIQPGDSPALEVVVVRHAEKLADGDDPALSDAGRARAQRLADLLRDAPLVAAYATDTQRARQTAKPSADEHGLALTLYDPRVPPAEFVARLRELHPQVNQDSARRRRNTTATLGSPCRHRPALAPMAMAHRHLPSILAFGGSQ